MLAVVLLILLTSGILASTIRLATQQLRTRTQEADAQLLCSALSLFVQTELTYAEHLDQSGGALRFTDHVQGFGTGCAFVSLDADGNPTAEDVGGRLAVEYLRSEGGSGTAKYFEAAGAGAYGGGKNLREQHTISYDDARQQVNVTIRVLNDRGVELAKNEFAVRPLPMLRQTGA